MHPRACGAARRRACLGPDDLAVRARRDRDQLRHASLRRPCRDSGGSSAMTGRSRSISTSPSEAASGSRSRPARSRAGSALMDGFIKGESMLDTGRYPTASFNSAGVTRTGERSLEIRGRIDHPRDHAALHGDGGRRWRCRAGPARRQASLPCQRHVPAPGLRPWSRCQRRRRPGRDRDQGAARAMTAAAGRPPRWHPALVTLHWLTLLADRVAVPARHA